MGLRLSIVFKPLVFIP